MEKLDEIINDLQDLSYKKEKLQKELWDITYKIEKYQENCKHISVCVGYDGPYQYRDTSYHQCLLCGQIEPKTFYEVIDASYYKEFLYDHGQIKEYRSNRLKDLQNKAKIFLINNPNLTHQDLVKLLKQEILEEKNIEKDYAKILVANKKH